MSVFKTLVVVLLSIAAIVGGAIVGKYGYEIVKAWGEEKVEETLQPSPEMPPVVEPEEEPETPPAVEPKEEPKRMMGDVDDNGVIDIEDLKLVQNYVTSSSKNPLTEEQMQYADIDHSGVVDLRDCQYIMMYTSGNIDSLEGIGG